MNTFFDVFLCHNSADKDWIRKINSALRLGGVATWFDEEQMEPGRLWQPLLEEQIGRVRKACVFVGQNGRGPWQDMEIRAFLSEFTNRSCPVIPVLLPDAPEAPDLPIFLKQMMWVDLRKDYDTNLIRLIKVLRS
ncbi:MAG: toll/interleukin-1 receptor domain-containing protein [Gemmatimonadetes bacterium]|nr:toll/interleukin-1 receptor domain-containing protein [Gemmatimonadota bacterium]